MLMGASMAPHGAYATHQAKHGTKHGTPPLASGAARRGYSPNNKGWEGFGCEAWGVT